MLNLYIKSNKAVSKLIFVGTEKMKEYYIVSVAILENLYKENPILSDIYFEPIWANIKTFDGNIDDIVDAKATNFTEHQKHIGELKRIQILEGLKGDKAKLSLKELKFLEKINNEIQNVQKQLDVQYKKRDKFTIDLDKVYLRLERYKYTIYVNGQCLKKPQNGSIGDMIISRCLKQPNQKIEIQDLKHARTVVAILNDMGFNKVLRKLFFPLISETDIECRPEVTGRDIIKSQLAKSDLERWLK